NGVLLLSRSQLAFPCPGPQAFCLQQNVNSPSSSALRTDAPLPTTTLILFPFDWGWTGFPYGPATRSVRSVFLAPNAKRRWALESTMGIDRRLRKRLTPIKKNEPTLSSIALSRS